MKCLSFARSRVVLNLLKSVFPSRFDYEAGECDLMCFQPMMTEGASQSAPLFSSQGTDQGVGHFKACLNRKNPSSALERSFPEKSHNAPQKLGSIGAHYAPLPEITSLKRET